MAAASVHSGGNSFLTGGGQMGDLMRQYNWANNQLGPIDQWPASLRTLVNMLLNSRFPMLIFWGPDLITFYNDAFRPSLGNEGKHPSSLGQPARQVWVEVWPIVGDTIQNIVAGGQAVYYEDRKVPLYRNGKLDDAYWTYSYSPIHNDNGTVGGVLVTCIETTKGVENIQKLHDTNQELRYALDDNKGLHDTLKRSEQRLLQLFDQSPVAIAVISKDKLTFQLANADYCKLVDRPASAILNKPLLEALPEIATQGFDRLLHEVIATGIPYVADEVPVVLQRADEMETVYLDFAYQPMREPDNSISGVLVVATDVTKPVKARKAVEISELRFQNLIEEAPFATALYVGEDLVIDIANEAMLRLWGKPAGVIGSRLEVALPELEGQPFIPLLQEVYKTGVAYTTKEQSADLVVDGLLQRFWFNFTYKPLIDENGKVYGILNMAVDISSQVQAKKELAEAESNLSLAIEMAHLATWRIDLLTNQITYSDRFQEWLGYTSATMEEESPRIHPNDRERIYAAIQNVIKGNGEIEFDEEYTILNIFTNTERIIHASGLLLKNADGEAIALVGTAQDITIQKNMQLSLEKEVQLRTEALEAAVEELRATNEELNEANLQLIRSNEELAQYAFVASHDLQEPLRKISMFSNMLGRKNQTAEQMQGIVDKIQRSTDRMSLLIKDLLLYSRLVSPEGVWMPVSLQTIVQDIIQDFELVIEEKQAAIQVGDLPTIEGISLQMNQLFYNLIGNALKFTAEGTRPLVQVSARAATIEEVEKYIAKPVPDILYHLITVADNGIGFDSQYMTQIFNLFEQLHGKQEYAGSGIGLAICRRVVLNHSGNIWAEATPGAGATFFFLLPERQ